jgi:hypothetical protein
MHGATVKKKTVKIVFLLLFSVPRSTLSTIVNLYSVVKQSRNRPIFVTVLLASSDSRAIALVTLRRISPVYSLTIPSLYTAVILWTELMNKYIKREQITARWKWRRITQNRAHWRLKHLASLVLVSGSMPILERSPYKVTQWMAPTNCVKNAKIN